jgi:ADP-heptose:LPS heptosyltransferase
MKKYYVSLLALGDNLISLSLLEQLDYKVNILGTRHTLNIAKLMNIENKLNIEIIFEDIPAFYDIKKRGIVKSVIDFYKFIIFIKRKNINELVFEKKDFRTILVAFFTHVKIYYPDIQISKVYNNRKKFIENVYNKNIHLNKYNLQLKSPKIIVINPLTRVELKNIKHSHLRYIIEELNQNGYEIYLVDIEKKYKEFEHKVRVYLTNTTLEDIKQLIKRCDLYIGGDSFLIHLSYYLQKNYFIIFYRDNDDFLPPNATDEFYIKAHVCNNFETEIIKKFKDIKIIQ